MITIRESELYDAHLVGLSLRMADVKELVRSGEQSCYEATLRSYHKSNKSWTGVCPQGVIAIGGIAEDPMFNVIKGRRTGIPWLLGSNLLDKHLFKLAKVTKKYVDEMLDEYDYLYNLVDVENEKAIQWLTWAGFEFGETYTAPSGYPFLEFYMEKT